jgi:membrane-bound serine protease (ClpP class)
VHRTAISRPHRRLLACALALLALWLGAAPGRAAAPVVYVAAIEGMIDAGLAGYVRRVIGEAERAGAAALVLEVDTFGGRVDAAVVIRDALLGTTLDTVAFVDGRAISAGALVALAAQRITMAPGATIGAAAPVEIGASGPPQPAGEKTVSYLRKEFRATAELRDRPADVAEAMVDADVAIPGVIDRGKLLTLTTGEALELGVADDRADDLDAVLARLGLAGAEVRHPTPNWAEALLRVLTHPAMSSLLLTLGTLGLLIEIRTPGFGVPGIVGLLSLVLFFWAHWLLRLVGWEEVALLVVGLVLLALEAFVIPGFGIAGVLGIASLLAGLGLSLVGAGVTPTRMLGAFVQVLLSLLLALGGAAVLLRFLPRLPIGRRLVLATGLPSELPVGPPPEPVLPRPGARGTTTSPLRPAGIADIGGARIDVVSDGGWVAPGEPVEVVRVEGRHVVVRRAARVEG